MDGYVWYVIETNENNKYYAHAFRIRRNINLASFVQGHPHMTAMNACTTMKEAKTIADYWNRQYKANGTYLFS